MTKQDSLRWFDNLSCAVTVCDRNYVILYMNDKAAEATAKEGGKSLVGKSLMDCHPPKAQKRIKEVMASNQPYVFTIEKKGVRKMVYDGHWTKDGRVGGLVEIYFELPSRIKKLVRN